MVLRIPARNVAGDQIMESVTNANTNEEQVVRLGGTFAVPATTGTITASAQSVTATSVIHAGNLMAMVYGTHAGINLSFEGLMSAGGNTIWVPIPGIRVDNSKPETTTGVLTANSAQVWQFDVSGFDQFRVRSTAYTSGTLNVLIDPMVAWGEPSVSANIMNPPTAQLFSLTPANAGIATATTTEALASLVPTTDLGSGGASTTHLVPLGKTLRILGFQSSFRGVAATATVAIIQIKANKSGTVVTASPPAAQIQLTVPAVANSHQFASPNVGQFIELPGGTSFGITTVLTIANAGSLTWPSMYGILY
jgi:hypothetical protein